MTVRLFFSYLAKSSQTSLHCFLSSRGDSSDFFSSQGLSRNLSGSTDGLLKILKSLKVSMLLFVCSLSVLKDCTEAVSSLSRFSA